MLRAGDWSRESSQHRKSPRACAIPLVIVRPVSGITGGQTPLGISLTYFVLKRVLYAVDLNNFSGYNPVLKGVRSYVIGKLEVFVFSSGFESEGVRILYVSPPSSQFPAGSNIEK